MTLTINKHEVFMKKLLRKALHLKQPLQPRMKLHVDVLHLKRLGLSVIVQCKAHVSVMEHVDVMPIFAKNKSVQ